ncbi:hypothetical protein D039_3428A, partial [Vibrio parahaemolyticus EKP-028]
MINSAIQHFLA